MRKPAIITVDDDALVSEVISRDLRSRYDGVGTATTTSLLRQLTESTRRISDLVAAVSGWTSPSASWWSDTAGPSKSTRAPATPSCGCGCPGRPAGTSVEGW